MRWKIGQFEFNQSTNVLCGPSGDTLLEPKTAALLAYFIQNTDSDISRDDLLEHVWHGQIVSENAINRVVVRLRKALGDDDKIKAYIVTVPKVGYRFVMQAQEITNQAPSTDLPAKPKHRPIIYALLLSPILTVGWLLVRPADQPIQGGAHVSPLVRLAGEQFDGAMANDQEQFVYSHAHGNNSKLYWVETTGAAPKLVSPETGRAFGAVWSNDGLKLVYQYRMQTRCEYHLVEFSTGTPSSPTRFYDCTGKNSPSFAFSLDDTKLYFIERANQFSPAAAYEYTFSNNSKRHLSQPVTTGVGNYYLDHHPTKNLLLLLGTEKPGHTSVFTLDPTQNTYRKLLDFSYAIDNAIWGHKPDTIVHLGEHPSYQLMETNVASKETQILVTDSRRIAEPKRINNGRDYLFRSYLYNLDIAIDGITDPDINSSVRDYLPAYSHTGSRLAFISKRAGYSQIWINNVNTGDLVAIDVIDRGRKYHDLAWSYDDTHLVATTDAGLTIVDTANNSVADVVNFDYPTYAVSWLDDETLNYSHFQSGHWELYEYNIRTQISSLSEGDWAAALNSADKNMFFDQGMQLRDTGGETIDTTDCRPAIYSLSLTYQLVEDALYCLAQGSPQAVLRLAPNIPPKRLPIPASAGTHYSVKAQSVATSIVSSATSDIMRTNFQ